MEMILKHKRETVYTIILFVMFQMAVIAYELHTPGLYKASAIVAMWVIFSWSLFTYYQKARRSVSKYSEVLLRVKLFDRFIPYFVTPAATVGLMMLFLYLNKSGVLRQLVIVLGSVYLWGILAFIKDSYDQFYSVSGWTRVMYKFADIFLFYLAVSCIYLEGWREEYKIVAVIAVTAILLMHQLKLYTQKSIQAYIVYAMSVVAMAVVLIVARNLGVGFLMLPQLLSLFFYLIISLWYLRLSGHSRLDEYLTPILFALMGLIVVLSF